MGVRFMIGAFDHYSLARYLPSVCGVVRPGFCARRSGEKFC